jgi:hypothetical protein
MDKKERAPISLLYAAPAFLRKNKDKDKENEKEGKKAKERTGRLYAAPLPEAEISGVYAGPGMRFGGRMQALYAAPGFFGKPEEDEKKDYPACFEEDEPGAPENETVPEPAEEPVSESEEPVPEPEEEPVPEPEEEPEAKDMPRPDISQFMCVYAAPGFFPGERGASIKDVYACPMPPEEPEEPEKPDEIDEEMRKAMLEEPHLMGLVMADPDLYKRGGIMGMAPLDNNKEKKPFVERENGHAPKFCRECGAKLSEGQKFCSNCGAKIFKC